ncbi:MAG: E3 ubiquitin-protein ligase MARCH [Flavobacteriia bacterium]|nr:E3 ubiquitin-protein ligase MARCH [Flavobacteriia bacterium]
MPKSADPILCRFCLQEDEKEVNNPFLTPCGCTGSIRYVHLECINKWRLHTNLPRHQINCQLCLQRYHLPRRWQLEMVPLENEASEGIWFYLSRPWITFILTNYTYVGILTFISPIYQQYAYIYLRPAILEDDLTITWSYMISLCALTFVYVLFAAQQFLKVVNKMRYLEYYWDMASNYLFMMIVTIAMTITWPFLFGTIYIIALPRGHKFHRKVLLKLNADGEF